MLVLDIKLLIATIILVGGVLLLLPQNGVMAWVESASITTMVDNMTDTNKIASDHIISSVKAINHSVDYSSEKFAMMMIKTEEHIQTVLDTINEFTSKLEIFRSTE
ncbi:MAG: hypothetical protein K8823_243 [Cenarchaeum symbiont of Oopsacas minuta]|nr:hypothetical protein [Cenarchaeum symbiont of Oopsacas minuta]